MSFFSKLGRFFIGAVLLLIFIILFIIFLWAVFSICSYVILFIKEVFYQTDKQKSLPRGFLIASNKFFRNGLSLYVVYVEGATGDDKKYKWIVWANSHKNAIEMVDSSKWHPRNKPLGAKELDFYYHEVQDLYI